MTKEQTRRRHVREKAVIGHLAKRMFDPAAAEGPAVRDAQTETGLSVEKQVRKEWNSRKGGLPTFCKTGSTVRRS
jgi:hypothetical protein